MKILHILTGGSTGGIETLCREIGTYSRHTNGFCFLTFGGEIYEQMKGMGLKTYPIFGLSPKKLSIKKLCVLLRILKEYDVVVVHHADPYIEIYYGLIKKLLNKKGIRYVHSCYGDESQIKGNRIKIEIEDIIRQWTLSCSDEVICVSQAGRESCELKYRLNKDKTCIIYNGVSAKYLEKTKELKRIDTSIINLLYVGRLEFIKGVDLLIKAVAELSTKYDLRLYIVGDGTEKENLKTLAARAGIRERVLFEGKQVIIDDYLNKADVFIYPSICQEVFGISIVEAMAYGIPVVANPVGGIPEIVHTGINGFLTKECSVRAIYDTLKDVIGMISTSSDSLFDIRKEACNTATRFSIINTCNQFDDLMEDLFS